MRVHNPMHRRHGVSIVEALVALAVMSFGMLALVGVQATMRLNSDLAKQRSEATRIASEEIERLRSFSTVTIVPGQPDTAFDEIASRTVEGYVPPDGIGNTTYRVERNVTLVPGSRQKVLTVMVRWNDRTNTQQSVTLDSVISRTAPNLGALLTLAPRFSPISQRQGRHVTIPPDAVDLGNGDSRFEPPGAAGIAWYFNNLSGVMRVCNAAGDVCVTGTLVSGTVRYHGAAGQPSGADAESPQGPALNLAAGPNALALVPLAGAGADARCYADTLSAAALAASNAVNYFCAIMPSQVSGWGGKLDPQPVDAAGALVTFAGNANGVRSCRYTTDVPSADDPNADFTVNADHPKTYCMEKPGTPTADTPCTGKRVTGNLINQNFLVIPGNRTCPTDEGGTNPLINGNTRQHQP